MLNFLPKLPDIVDSVAAVYVQPFARDGVILCRLQAGGYATWRFFIGQDGYNHGHYLDDASDASVDFYKRCKAVRVLYGEEVDAT